jgi:hypothetical protein
MEENVRRMDVHGTGEYVMAAVLVVEGAMVTLGTVALTQNVRTISPYTQDYVLLMVVGAVLIVMVSQLIVLTYQSRPQSLVLLMKSSLVAIGEKPALSL